MLRTPGPARPRRDRRAAPHLIGAEVRRPLPGCYEAGGSLRQSELAASLGWDRTRLSYQLTRMSKRQLVTRERTGGVIVALTDTGRRAITAVDPGLEAAVRRHFTDKLSAQEIETLTSVLHRL